MSPQAGGDLTLKTCVPCEGGIPPLDPGQVADLLKDVPGWHLTHEGRRVRRDWKARNFVAAMDFFNQVAALAEAEGHHPDLHLEGYRLVGIEVWTHAIGGLSENDFILAAKIDRIAWDFKA